MRPSPQNKVETFLEQTQEDQTDFQLASPAVSISKTTYTLKLNNSILVMLFNSVKFNIMHCQVYLLNNRKLINYVAI